MMFHGYLCWSVIFSLVTHLNYQENISGPPELTPYFRNGTNEVLSRVLIICIVSLEFLTCLASFHPSLHPYTAAQQPHTSLQNK